MLVQIVIDVATLLRHRRPGAQDGLESRRSLRIPAGGALPIHRELRGRSAGGDAQHLLRCNRNRRSRSWIRTQRRRPPGRSAWTWLRHRHRRQHPAAPRRRHSAGRSRAFPSLAHAASTGCTRATLLGGVAGAGNLAGATRSVDHPQLARFPPLHAARTQIRQRSRRIRYRRIRHWIRTWVVDYVSTEEVYWVIPGDNVASRRFPRAPATTRSSAPRRRRSSTTTTSPSW